MSLNHRVNYRPCGFNRILTGEQRSIPSHGVSQKTFVGSLLSRLFFRKVEFFLVTDIFLAWELNSGGKGNS